MKSEKFSTFNRRALNTIFKQSPLKLAVGAALAFGGITSALAGTVGATVGPINALAQTDVANVVDDARDGLTAVTIVSGTIDNNQADGWTLKVTSANVGKLTRAATGDGTVVKEIPYTNVTFATTGGTLGAGLTVPNLTKDITLPVTAASGIKATVAGEVIFNTGATTGDIGVATTATEGYAYTLAITTAADTTLLAGKYEDTITLVLSNDAI